jgi:hypothetical protein
MHQFDLLYEKFKAFGQRYRFTSRKAETDFDELLEELQKAIGRFHKEVDKRDVISCLEAIHLLKNINWSRCTDQHVVVFLDIFTKEELSVLFGVTTKTIYSKIGNIQRKGKPTTFSDTELPADIESIKNMSNEEFLNLASMQARLTVIKALSSANVTQFSVEMAKQILIGERDQKVKDVEKMWQLCKDWLAWWASDCIPKMVRKITQARPPFDAKVLMAEVADDKYDELKKKYREVKPREETPWDGMVKKAKRRGKWKEVRQREEKEAKLLKASSSTAPIPSENAESASNSVGEELDA